jgi:hypothetical protein
MMLQTCFGSRLHTTEKPSPACGRGQGEGNRRDILQCGRCSHSLTPTLSRTRARERYRLAEKVR